MLGDGFGFHQLGYLLLVGLADDLSVLATHLRYPRSNTRSWMLIAARGRDRLVVGRPVRELQPCMSHIEQHGPVNLCGSLCQPHAIFS
jgi:hypothetical protein